MYLWFVIGLMVGDGVICCLVWRLNIVFVGISVGLSCKVVVILCFGNVECWLCICGEDKVE